MKRRSILIFLLVTLTHVCITPFYNHDDDDNDDSIAFVITDSSGRLQSKNKDEQSATTSSEDSATGQTSVEYRTVSSPKKFVNSKVTSGIAALINSNPISRGIAVSIAAVYNICGFFQDRHQKNEDHKQEQEQCGRPIVTGFVENPPDGAVICTSVPNESGDVQDDTMYLYNNNFATGLPYPVNHGTVHQSFQQQIKHDTIYQQKLATLKQHRFNSDARLRAIEHTRASPWFKICEQFSIDKAVIECAESYGIAHHDLMRNCMNVYEYRLHTEFIEQITQVTELIDIYRNAKQYKFFLDVVGQGVAIGIEANRKQEPIVATHWSDFCYEALEIAKGVGEGLLLGTYNTARFAKNVVRHPIRTTRETVSSIGTIVSAAGKAIGVSLKLSAMCMTGNAETAYKEAQEIYDKTCFLMQECTDKMATMSNREIAKHTTAFATEWALTGKAFTVAHSICSRAGPLIAQRIAMLRKTSSVQSFIASAAGVSCQVGATKKVGNAAQEAVKHARSVLTSLSSRHMAHLEPKIAHLKEIFDCRRKGFGEFANKWIKINYEHIFGMEFKFSKKGKINISGFHHNPKGSIARNGLLQFKNRVRGKKGFFKADIFYEGIRVKRDATFFPSSWSHEKVIRKIYESYGYCIRNGFKNFTEKGGKYTLIGKIKEGVDIKMCITKKGRIVTAYPILK